ncbi:uncharacterized protein LOC123015587 isoform X2 [Tribolium madens]|uniref:uncharacterized protein LOC123015587 isoform X2 n=1 Tax=Tribolium madens TaxID=41895 RepID=UPI001CF71F69|nr:uncharacterized protein LOC123015587 isoform X2 [Tribolium madens]
MGFLMEFGIIFLSLLFIATFIIKNKNPPAILNIYQRPNGFFWFKFIFMFTVLSLKKLAHKFKKRKEIEEINVLDRPQNLSAHPKAIDAVYFNGANKNGDYLVVGTARRKKKLVDGFLYLLIKNSGLGLLETPKLPGTALYQTEEIGEYEAEGLKISPQEPMRKWKISYEGKMKRFENRKEFVDVKIEAEWSSTLPYFNFDSDMDPWAMAKSMAYEKFSREYFENLKANHQTHYEQHGDIKGVAIINGRSFKININAVRDHSFGLQREWRNFHRYGLHFVTAENGDRFNVGKICLPISFSRLTIGYVYSAKEDKIHPVRSCDLELYQHGEGGDPPEDYAFSFEAGKKRYLMQVNVLHSPHFYISKDWESKVVERLCTFEINGMKGWGAAEWQYRNVREKKCKCDNEMVMLNSDKKNKA